MESDKLKGHLLALTTMLLWGTTFVSTKVLLSDFTPIEILFLRTLLGYVLLRILYPKRIKVTDKKQKALFIAAGLSGIYLYYLFENTALVYSMASNISVITSTAPFFSAIFAYKFLAEEKPRPSFFVGFVVAISGIALVSFSGGEFKFEPKGDIMGLLSAAIWGVYSVITKIISKNNYNTVQMTSRIFEYGLMFMIPTLFISGFDFSVEKFLKPVNMINILYLGFGASALCFVMWNTALQKIGVVRASVYIYLNPVITIVLSYFVLNERLTLISTIGAILTVFGLVISELHFDKIREKFVEKH